MDGILIISFGTTYRQSREKTINVFVETFQKAFPDMPVYLAFMSKKILKKIQEKEGIYIDTIEEAFKRMYAEGITRIFIQPTYIFHEIEKDDMTVFWINKYKRIFPGGIFVGAPLLKDKKENEQIFSVLFQELLKNNTKFNVSRETLDDTVIIFVGHPYHDYHNKNNDRNYPFFHNDECYKIEKNKDANIYIGAITDADSILNLVRKQETIKHVVLIPVFFLIGKHALEDVAGAGEFSWKSKFQKAGYEVELVLKGIGEYAKIREFYVERLREIIIHK